MLMMTTMMIEVILYDLLLFLNVHLSSFKYNYMVMYVLGSKDLD